MVRTLLGKSDMYAYLVRILTLIMVEHIFILALSGTKNHQLYIHFG